MNIELFPCSGGMAEGLRRAGISIDLAFDFDKDACDSYELNLGHRPVRMDVRDLLRMVRAGWSPGPVDFLCADPPCTPWSNAGKKLGMDDDRDMLLTTMMLIERLLPTCWIVANVPGLDNSDNWKSVVQPVIGGMAQRSGYCVDYASLDAADFGVPQHRRRPFWFGHFQGTPCIDWPHPTHCAPPVLPGCGLKPHVTCREAFGHLPIEELGRKCRTHPRGGHSASGAPDKPAGTIVCQGRGGGAYGTVLRINSKHRPQEMDEPSTTLRGGDDGHSAPQVVLQIDPKHSINDADAPANAVLSSDGCESKRAIKWRRNHEMDKPGRTVTAAHEGGNGRCLDWPWDRPSTTLQGDERLNAAGHHDPAIPNSQHGEQAIVLSEKAGAILQGFPESWVFCGKTKRARWGQIGMATPPPLAEAVGRSIVAWFARSISR